MKDPVGEWVWFMALSLAYTPQQVAKALYGGTV